MEKESLDLNLLNSAEKLIRCHFLLGWRGFVNIFIKANKKLTLKFSNHYSYLIDSSFVPADSKYETWGLHSVVANELDCDIEVNAFELQSRYYVHFRINIFRKGINPFIPSQWVRKYFSSSKSVNLAQRLIYHKTKKQRNQTNQAIQIQKYLCLLTHEI